MILEEFDTSKSAVINPDMIVPKIPDFPDVTVSCFSRQLFANMLDFLYPNKSANPIVPQA